jgi:hypothetical protein
MAYPVTYNHQGHFCLPFKNFQIMVYMDETAWFNSHVTIIPCCGYHCVVDLYVVQSARGMAS